ncbi:hypothetical protein ACSBR1_023734 [Camellia fascicularis]
MEIAAAAVGWKLDTTVRRDRISERMRKLRELVPNMDKVRLQQCAHFLNAIRCFFINVY